MFRLSVVDENAIQEFHKLHLDARNQEFGRLFRSPSLFEDIVKTLLLCNCKYVYITIQIKLNLNMLMYVLY